MLKCGVEEKGCTGAFDAKKIIEATMVLLMDQIFIMQDRIFRKGNEK